MKLEASVAPINERSKASCDLADLCSCVTRCSSQVSSVLYVVCCAIQVSFTCLLEIRSDNVLVASNVKTQHEHCKGTWKTSI